MRLSSVLLDIVSKILRGKASKDEVQKFNSWYDKGIDTEWHIQDHKKRDKAQIESELLQNIRRATGSKLPDNSYAPTYSGWKIAASIILVVGLGILLLKMLPEEKPESGKMTYLTFENSVGMIKKVKLPDGSMVSLFHDTQIQVAENFTENRWVKLSGEAFFEVQRDTLHPFRVESTNLTTEVLGTSFLIKNLPDQQETVAVKTGLVKVSHQADTSFMLSPNLRLDYENARGKVSEMPTNDPLFAWTKEVLVFENTSMSEMIATLEDWYGVQITADLKPSNTCQISGTYEKQTLENLLQLIQYSIPITYQIDGKNVSLTFKNCP